MTVLFNEQLPKRRVVIRDLVRWEWRRFSYSDGAPSSSSGRLRNRLEFLFPINRPNLPDDGTIDAIADWEWFVPLSDPNMNGSPAGAVTGEASVTGTNRHWQTAALYIRTNSRNTIDEPFTTSENVLDLQLKRVW